MKIFKKIEVKKEKQNLVLKHIKTITNFKNTTCQNAKILTKSPNTIIVMLIALIISAIAITGNFAAFAKYAMSSNKTVQVNFAETTKYYENQTTSTQYDDLQTAVDEATSGDAIKVINTAILNQVITIPTNKEITIDLNSYTISGENTITNNGTLTIIDTSVAGTGAITSTANSGISNSSGAILTIGNTNDGTISIASPIITGSTYGVYNQGTFNYYDGILQGTMASYYGSITAMPTNYDTATNTVNIYYVTTLRIVIAQIGTMKYGTLTEAIVAVPTTGTQTTITMVSNTDVTEESITIDASKNILLDLNGKTIMSTGNTIINNGTLEVKDTSTEQTGTISTTSSSSSYYAIYNANAATFTLTSGTISGIYRAIENYYTGVTTIVGGTVKVTGTTSSTYAIYNYGTSSNVGTINITGGTITSGGYGITNVYSSLSLTGGTITASCGIHSNSGTTNITGGTVTSSVNYGINAYSGTVNITGGTVTSSSNYGIYAYTGTVTIGSNDGTISPESPVIAGIYGVCRDSGTVYFYDGIIKGINSSVYYANGTEPTVPSGCKIVKTTTAEDGYYTATLEQSTIITAQIGSVNYNSLEAAIAAVPTDGTQTTIKMIRNIKETTYSIANSQNIILDLNGKKIESTGITITNNGILQIIDSVGTGSISSSENYAIYNTNSGILNIGISDGLVSTTAPVISGTTYGIYKESGTINFYDGIIKGINSSVYYGNITNIESLYSIITSSTKDSNGYYTATLTTTYVAAIGKTGYTTLEAAITAVPTETLTNITMLNDVSSSSYYTIPMTKKIKLELNGKIISSSSTSYPTIRNNGDLRIQDSTGGGKISSTGNVAIYNYYSTSSAEWQAQLKISGGTITSSASYAINNYFGVASITNATIISSSSYAIYTANECWLGINSGTVVTSTASYAIYYSATENSDLFIGYGSDGSNSPVITGKNYGIYAINTNNNSQPQFYGGKIRGTSSSVYSGTFTYPSGYQIVKTTSVDSEGYYTATVDSINKAKIGETQYSTLTEAIAAVPTDGTQTTIIMLGNVSSSTYYTIADNQNVLLEINGKRIESSSTLNPTITNNGQLTIQDSVGEGKISNTSTNFAINNKTTGILTLGSNDNIINTETPMIVGYNYYALSNSGIFNYYDGILKGKIGTYTGKITTHPIGYDACTSQTDDLEITILSQYIELVNEVQIGDYVTYIPNKDTEYSIQNDYVGYSGEQIITKEDLSWRVLSKNENTGEVTLIAATPTAQTLYLSGSLGYSNGVQTLNKICNSLYSNGTIGTARSIKIEDIEAISSYEKNVGQTITYTTGLNYPALYGEEIGAGIDTDTVNTTGFDVSEDHYDGTFWTGGYKTCTSSLKSTNTYYTYAVSNFITGIYYEMLIQENFKTKNYWIASRSVHCLSEYCSFGMDAIDSNIFGNKELFQSNLTNDISSSLGIMPVVSLKDNIQTIGQDASGVWQLVIK